MEQRRVLGFTLIEFLISMILVVILIGVAIPTYYHYRRKAFYSEIVNMAEYYQSAINNCMQHAQRNFTDCDAGKYGIPNNISDGPGLIESATVTDGVITVTPRPGHGVKATDTYILTPKVNKDNQISWTASGGGCKSGFAQGC